MAPPRTFKTAFLADVILRYRGPVIATTKADLFKLTSAVRSFLVHGEAQLAERWGEHGRQVVLDTSSVKVFLPGITDTTTLQAASTLCGLEALGEDVRGDPGDLAGQVIEPLRPAEQRLDHQRRPPVTDPGQRPASGDEPLSCSAMSGS
jgi:TraM recognition site of TraD and TraG